MFFYLFFLIYISTKRTLQKYGNDWRQTEIDGISTNWRETRSIMEKDDKKTERNTRILKGCNRSQFNSSAP